MTKAQVWHDDVRDNARGLCEAQQHDPRCRYVGQVAHHICFRSQIPKSCYWIVANGIWISEVCHLMAHAMHNANLSSERTIAAVDAVNAAIPDTHPDLKVPYFRRVA